MDASQLPLCPVETTLKLIGDKWKVLILRDLMEGTKRFGQLRRTVGSVSTKVLTEQLRQMERTGLSAGKCMQRFLPASNIGRSLSGVLDAMKAWGLHYKSSLADSAQSC